MKKIIALLLIVSSLSGFAQVCTHTIPSPNSIPGGGIYHVSNDSTINDQDGSIYYLCSGVHLTVEGSAGCTYYLEDNCQLTIKAHDGDIVNAKGYCTIIDSSSQSIVVNKEVSSTFLKPFMPSLGIVFTCSSMVYDYSLVGGSSPCSQTTGVNDFIKASISLYPNPTDENFSIDLGEKYQTLSVTIIDMSGRIIHSNIYNDRQFLNLKLDEPAGIYFLMIESGDIKTTIRLIKK